jgi:hypothetical protein
MLGMVSMLIPLAVALQPHTSIVLGQVERDLTGDGKPEILRVVAIGPTTDHLDATFTIESGGKTIYTFKLEPLTRTVGFDAGRRTISAEQQRVRLEEFGPWFFGEEKFQPPEAFVDGLRREARLRVAEIPTVIASDQQSSETRDGNEIWEEILKSPVTIFTFSPGGDSIVAIGWSARAGRFYRLLECC